MRSQSDPKPMLSFLLTPQLQAVIPVDELIGITNIETVALAPIPDTPKSVMGIYSYRGTIVWIVDLPCLLELTPLYLANNRQSCSIIFLKSDQPIIGFAVHQIGQMLKFSENQLQPDYTNPGAQRLNWCINGIYSDKANTLLSIQSDKVFELLMISKLTV